MPWQLPQTACSFGTAVFTASQSPFAAAAPMAALPAFASSVHWIASGRARYTFGPTGLEDTFDAGPGDFVYIPAGEIHVEENASDTEPLVVVISRNCPGSVVHYVDEG